MLRNVTRVCGTVFACIFLLQIIQCGGPNLYKRQRRLQTAAGSYNEKLRWQKYGAASSYIKKEQRRDFLKTFEPLRDIYQITEIRVISAELDEEDETRGTTQVWITYYRFPDATLKKELLEQSWEYDERRGWLLDWEPEKKE